MNSAYVITVLRFDCSHEFLQGKTFQGSTACWQLNMFQQLPLHHCQRLITPGLSTASKAPGHGEFSIYLMSPR